MFVKTNVIQPYGRFPSLIRVNCFEEIIFQAVAVTGEAPREGNVCITRHKKVICYVTNPIVFIQLDAMIAQNTQTAYATILVADDPGARGGSLGLKYPKIQFIHLKWEFNYLLMIAGANPCIWQTWQELITGQCSTSPFPPSLPPTHYPLISPFLQLGLLLQQLLFLFFGTTSLHFTERSALQFLPLFFFFLFFFYQPSISAQDREKGNQWKENK